MGFTMVISDAYCRCHCKSYNINSDRAHIISGMFIEIPSHIHKGLVLENWVLIASYKFEDLKIRKLYTSVCKDYRLHLIFNLIEKSNGNLEITTLLRNSSKYPDGICGYVIATLVVQLTQQLKSLIIIEHYLAFIFMTFYASIIA